MSMPAEIQTVILTWGRAFDVFGQGGTSTLSIEPVTPGTNKLVWLATGDPLMGVSASKAASDEAGESVSLPVVDQAGWVDSAGHPYADWAYKGTLAWRSKDGARQTEVKTFKVLSGQTVVDWDMIFTGTVGAPTVAPLGVVTDVAGLSGSVSVAALLDADTQAGAAVTRSVVGTVGSILADPVRTRTEGTRTAASATPLLLIDSDGALLRAQSTTLERSTDDGATWTAVGTLPQHPSGARQLDNGQLLVGGSEAPGTSKARLWLSTGYPAEATFTQVLEVADWGQTLDLAWGFGGGGDTYAVAEYDTKAPGARSAVQRAWITRDSGETWTQIYDHGIGAASSRHIHGVAVDPYRPGTVWLTLGDYTGTGAGDRRIRVSRDYGDTWEDVTTRHQPTAIMCFPNSVAFGSDNAPNGVLVIANPDATPAAMRVTLAYQITPDNAITHVAERPFRSTTSDGYVTLLPFSSATAGVRGQVLGSYDGLAWFEVWRDATPSTGARGGPYSAIGPTRDGRLHVRGHNPDGSRYDADVPLPTLPGIVTLAANLAQLQRMIPRRSYVAYTNSTTPYQTMVAYEQQTILLAPNPQRLDDVGGLFVRADDGTGIIVTRDVYLRIDASGGKPSTWSNRYDTILQINGATYVYASDTYLSVARSVTAGTKVSVAAQPNAYEGQLGGFLALTLEAWETGV